MHQELEYLLVSGWQTRQIGIKHDQTMLDALKLLDADDITRTDFDEFWPESVVTVLKIGDLLSRHLEAKHLTVNLQTSEVPWFGDSNSAHLFLEWAIWIHTEVPKTGIPPNHLILLGFSLT